MKQRESVCPLPNTATSESLYPRKSKPSFFYLIISLSTLSLCFTSLSLLHVCLSPSVSGASLSLSLSPSPPHSAVNPFFYLIISLTHVLHSLSLCVSLLSLLHVSLSPSISGAPLSLPCGSSFL